MKSKFDGPWLNLLEISLKNLLLRIITLGIYHPWARVNVRRFTWQHFILDGDRFEFTGNGRELFIGFVKFFSIFLVVSIVTTFFAFVAPGFLLIWRGVVLAVYALTIPFFIFSARRYLLSRTKWRGLRFGLSRVRNEYIIAFIVGSIASFVSLGLAVPWARFRNHKILTDATMYGGLPFRFEGSLRDYYLIYARGLVLLVLTLGVYLPWFIADLTRYNFSHTRFDGATFRLDVKGWELLRIYLLTVVVSVVTFGFGIPWATVYRMKYLSERFSVDGAIDFERLQQMAPSADAMADSMVDYFDLDLGW